ncbi:hypothetical protein JCM6882_008340 [Rhodosporidiobolus microsporus]
MTGLGAATADSERRWLSDLDSLRREVPFSDLVWASDDPERTVRAHKCIVYARATGSFQQRYIGVPHSISEADLSIYGHSSASFRTFTPTAASHSHSLTPTPREDASSPRPSSSTDRSAASDTLPASPAPLSLGATDVNVFEAAIEYFYTAAKEAEAFATVLDGFQDACEADGPAEDAVAKLRQDLLYCWRSKLYADVSLVLEGSDSAPFAAHRAILVSRSPYFRSLLLGNFGDSQQTVYTLPSPPFTPASTTFVLGYMYAGTLDFSSRKFDLSTAFEIWRCAAFLTMSSLQSEVEDKITGMLSLSRAARIFSFAHAADVNNPRLAAAALPLVLDRFEEVWAGSPIGHLPYGVQKQLVRQVCAAVQPDTVVKVAKKVSTLRSRVETERAVWVDHIRSMLDAVEEELVAVLASDLPATIASAGFVDLIDGVGFSTDVLEWLLTLVVKGLTEAKAPESYQGLVGSVLLREEGILADARVLVEDAKNGILKYIKRKWINVRAAGGFDELDSWCLKELADELDISVEDLVADGPRLRPSPARARHAPRRLLEGTPPAPRRHPASPPARPVQRAVPSASSSSVKQATAPLTNPKPEPQRTSGKGDVIIFVPGAGDLDLVDAAHARSTALLLAPSHELCRLRCIPLHQIPGIAPSPTFHLLTCGQATPVCVICRLTQGGAVILDTSFRSAGIDREACHAKAGVPGTTLLSGIPCIVTVRGSRSMRIKAMVRYIGQLVGETGQWVGVEALESAIPTDARELAWNDGSKNGVVYFKLASPSSSTAPKKQAPPPSSSQTPAAGGSGSSSGTSSSLRPASRTGRRSTTNEPAGGSGPRQGLFVRPDQILYVM